MGDQKYTYLPSNRFEHSIFPLDYIVEQEAYPSGKGEYVPMDAIHEFLPYAPNQLSTQCLQGWSDASAREYSTGL